jgi:hypothetical protein
MKAPRLLTRQDLLGRTAISYLRFSTPQQAAGSTEDRQQEAHERIFHHYELVLDPDVTLARLEDRGLSASKGHHRTRGNLRLLLDMVSARQIKRGTVLVIEAMDRLFREGIMDVFPLLKSLIVDGGLILVTGDMSIWGEAEINDVGLSHKLLAEINAARMYAQRLSQLASGGHAKKRRAFDALADMTDEELAAAPKPLMHSPPPAWIIRTKVGEGIAEYTLHPARAATLRRIFTMYADGYSTSQIAHMFNEERVPTFAAEVPYWNDRRIAGLLRQDSCIGFYRPGVRASDRAPENACRRVKLYPPAIDAATWVKVQERMTARAVNIKGRRGGVSNLLTRRIACGECGEPMRLDTRGGRRQPKYQCIGYLSGHACKNRKRYDVAHFEREIVWQLLNHTAIARPAPASQDDGLAEVEVQIGELKETCAMLLPLIAKSDTRRALFLKTSDELDALKRQREDLKLRRLAAVGGQSRTDEMLAFMRKLSGPALNGDPDARERLRSILTGVPFRVETSPQAGGSMVLLLNGETFDIDPPDAAERLLGPSAARRLP